jgi:hypothetical protein
VGSELFDRPTNPRSSTVSETSRRHPIDGRGPHERIRLRERDPTRGFDHTVAQDAPTRCESMLNQFHMKLMGVIRNIKSKMMKGFEHDKES